MPRDSLITSTFIAYLAVILAIGIWSYLRTKNLSDYILGGRRLGPVPSALSAGASDMSGWLLLGLPGYAYLAGLEAIWLAAGLFAGAWLNWLLVANRLRRFSSAGNDALTIPDYFEHRFADQSRALRVISAFFILLFFLFYTSSGLVAGGKLFEAVFGVSYRWAVIAGAVAVVSYTLLGGFLAVAWTDVVQGFLMLLALLAVPITVVSALGGPDSSLQATAAANPALLSPWSDSKGNSLSLIAILSLLGWGLGYFGQPHILARFKAIRSTGAIPAACRIAVGWSGLGLLGALASGLLAAAYFEQPLADSEKVFILLIDTLFNPLVAGVLLAAILAAIMSTADSQLLVASSALAEDFYKALLNPTASSQRLVGVGRLAVVVIAVLAALLALSPEAGVLELVSYAWAGFGAAFGPAIILSLYWPRMNRHGALAGIVTGGVTVVVWKQLEGGLFELYELVPGFMLATCAIVLVSRITPAPTASLQKIFWN